MNTLNSEALELVKNEEYDIPLDISDILAICKAYNQLSWRIQGQVESIIEIGVNESINSGNITHQSLPYIMDFLKQITKNAYFGDSVAQAQECIELIKQYQENIKADLISYN
jgi:hypothetical protein